MACLTVLFILTGLVFGARWYFRSKFGRFRSSNKLNGYTALVTGANTGIGKEVARDFASRGAKVILACRNRERAEAAKREIVASTRNSRVHVKIVDFSSFDSVRSFAEDINKTERCLHILVNNAAAAGLKPEITKDGIEIGLQTNHYSPFLLTNLLLPILKRSAPSRIVFVSSKAHLWAKPDFNNLDKILTGSQNYYHGKLFNLMAARGFAKRLEGTNITVNSVHPGTVASELFRNIPTVLRVLIVSLIGFFQKSTSEGAETVVHCAVSETLQGVTGKYYSDCKETNVSLTASNSHYEDLLWKHTEVKTGHTFKLPA